MPSEDEDDGVPELTAERRIAVSQLLAGDRSRIAADGSVRPWTFGMFLRLHLLAGEPDAAAPLLSAFRRQYPRARSDAQWLRTAYRVASYLHGDQRRKSGAPYITHPLAVATILAEMGMDAATLVAALLHDTVEDTDYTLAECRADFGPDVALLVDGVTKLGGERLDRETVERQTFAKMVLAAGTDLRVLLIKLVDRLHNMRTLGAKSPASRARIARQSMDLLVPFADRLGLYRLKREMEDLAFRHLHPDEYQAMAALAVASRAHWEGYLAEVTARIAAAGRGEGLRVTVTARPRHLYSLFQDNPDGRELSPGRSCRLVVVVDGGDQDCWITLGAVHQLFPPVPGRFSDFISTPKYNLYRSLHTRVQGPSGEELDMLIRTPAMDQIAEDGIAATIRDANKATGQAGATAQAQRRGDLEWLRRLLTWHPRTASEDYLDDLRTELRGSIIVIAAATGQFLTLPEGATGIDFAYARDHDIGNRLIGVQINGTLAPATARLTTGDIVEEITAPDPPIGRVTTEWLRAARTPQARHRLRALLDEHNTE
jgi:GTP diphosphokinase / guanosine-3',5'-bis(diphosphate) 3'-diphosphatase